MAREIIIGIDLGTTYSCCFYYNSQTNKVEVIQFMNGETSIPSSVDFNVRPVLVGIPNPKAISEVKRIIGVKFNDPQVQEEIANSYFPFDIVEDSDGYCKVSFQPDYSEETIQLTPEEVSAIVLRHMKNEVLLRLGLPNETIVNAVVTVPAFFTDAQKDRTRAAVEMSGLKLVRLFYEPSAAAYAYHEDARRNGFYLAFDLGGGTFDLTILESKNGGKQLKYITTTGDTHLGGLDFDKNFTDFVLQKWKDVDSDNNPVKQFIIQTRDTQARKLVKQQRLYRLRKIVEKAKIELSNATSTTIDLSEFYGGERFELQLEREEFEECNKEIFEKCIQITRDAFNGLKVNNTPLRTSSIQEIVLIGGSSQIPKIQEMLRKEFPRARINNRIKCDLVVAQGACLFCKEALNGGISMVTESVAHDIFMQGINGPMKIVEKNTALPHRDHELYVEVHDVEAYTELFEDERSLGKFTIKGIPRGDTFTIFHITIEQDGLLRVTGQFSNGKQVNVECSIQPKSSDTKQITINKAKIDRFFSK